MTDTGAVSKLRDRSLSRAWVCGMEEPIPVLTGQGDLGPALLRLMQEIETLRRLSNGKNFATERLCTCRPGRSVDNALTLGSRSVPADPVPSPHDAGPVPPIYGALAAVLASCGRVDALRLVEGYRPSLTRHDAVTGTPEPPSCLS